MRIDKIYKIFTFIICDKETIKIIEKIIKEELYIQVKKIKKLVCRLIWTQ